MAGDASYVRILYNTLRLDYPPVAVAPVSEVPAGVPFFQGMSPSSCAFWRHAEKHLFAVNASNHMNCSVGAMVMGFQLTDAAMQSLQQGVTMMCNVGYISPEEVQQIPTLSHGKETMLYGPLSQFPIAPEVVVLWVNAASVMLLREATGDAAWGEGVGGRVFGRPGCAALAVAQKSKEVTFSFGCMGMRTFTGVAPDDILAVIPGEKLDHLVTRLNQMDRANCSMQAHYEQAKQAFSFKPIGG